jgi:hypothetical protein
MIRKLKINHNVLRIMFVIITVLLIADIVTNWFISGSILRAQFSVVTEKNIPSLFSTIQLIFSGFLLNGVYHKVLDLGYTKTVCRFWKVLSILFYILAFDEWFTIHDTLGKVFSNEMGALGDVLGWTLLYIILMIIFAIWSLRFLLLLPRAIALGFILSGTVFLLGAIGLELLNRGKVQAIMGLHPDATMAYFIGLFEEAFEMVGIAFFNLLIFQYSFRYLKYDLFLFPYKFLYGMMIFGGIDILITIIVQRI